MWGGATWGTRQKKQHAQLRKHFSTAVSDNHPSRDVPSKTTEVTTILFFAVSCGDAGGIFKQSSRGEVLNCTDEADEEGYDSTHVA